MQWQKPISKEIAVILVLKIILIALIWYFLFSQPLTKKIDTHALRQHLLSQRYATKDNAL